MEGEGGGRGQKENRGGAGRDEEQGLRREEMGRERERTEQRESQQRGRVGGADRIEGWGE